MKKLCISLLTMIIGLSLFGMEPGPGTEELVIYAYDSFISWGLAEATMYKFEQANNCKITLIAVGDAGQVMNRVILKKIIRWPILWSALIIIIWPKRLTMIFWNRTDRRNVDLIPEDLILDPTFHLTPFEYGYIAFVYDSEAIQDPPKSLETLIDPQWKEKIILKTPEPPARRSITAVDDCGFWRRWVSRLLGTPEAFDSDHHQRLGYGLRYVYQR